MDTSNYALSCSERWVFGADTPRRRAARSFREERRTREQLTQVIREHRFISTSTGTRLRTPLELARIAKQQGISAASRDIEFAAARALLIIGSPKHDDTTI